MATSRSALILKRLSQRFGIRAQKMAVRTHVAWHWRALQWVVILSISLALGSWIYDEGRKMAGFHQDESSKELQSLRNYVMELDEEVTKLRAQAGTGESYLQIERATLKNMTQQVRVLEQENAALKEDLAFFERLMPSLVPGEASGIRIDQLRVEPEASPNTYRYRMLLVNSAGKKTPDFKGNFQVLVETQQAGKDVMITLPSQKEAASPKFRVEVKFFRRIEGTFTIPTGSLLKSIEVRLLQDGDVRARQTIKL